MPEPTDDDLLKGSPAQTDEEPTGVARRLSRDENKRLPIATDEHADVASYVLDFVLERMMINKLWSIREPRAFTWWPHKLAQRVWAEPIRMDEGVAICRIHFETALLKEVPPTGRTYGSTKRKRR